MGAITITEKQELGGLGLEQGKRYVRATCVFSNAYAAGGDTVNHASVGLKNITELFIIAAGRTYGKADLPGGIGARVLLGGTSTARTLSAYVGAATPAEVAAATDLSTVSVDVIFGGD